MAAAKNVDMRPAVVLGLRRIDKLVADRGIHRCDRELDAATAALADLRPERNIEQYGTVPPPRLLRSVTHVLLQRRRPLRPGRLRRHGDIDAARDAMDTHLFGSWRLTSAMLR